MHDLKEIPGCAGLWGIEAADCGLIDREIYHYWFEVTDSHPSRDGRRTLCTDPTALTVAWRLLADRLPHPYIADDPYPASFVKFADGLLVATRPVRSSYLSP